MNVYIVRYDCDENKTVTFHPNIKDAKKRRTEVKSLFGLGNKGLDEIEIEKVTIGRGKTDFLDLFNKHGISTLVSGIIE